jgi:hypothetical protein
MVLRFCAVDGGMRLLRELRQFRRALGITRDRFQRSSGTPRSN